MIEEKKNTFLEIQRQVKGISSKMLSKELKDLEMNKLVTRTLHDTRPITVEYAITDYGRSFLPLAKNLLEWGLEHRKYIMKQ